MGNVGDRWIWRGSLSTRNPPLPTSSPHIRPLSLPTPSLSQVATQPTPLTVIPSKHVSDFETLPSTFPSSRITNAPPQSVAFNEWVWDKVATESSSRRGTQDVLLPLIFETTETSFVNATLLHSVTSSSTSLEIFPNDTAATTTEARTSSPLYITNTEVYNIHSLANTEAIAGEFPLELPLPFSYLVLSVLAISLLVSLVANLLMLFTILRRSYLRQTIFVLYLNLAASDLLASVLTVPVVTLVFFRGGEEGRRDLIGPSVGTCSLLSAGMVLLCYVSVGSIVGICTVRWCQFCSSSKTRVQERLVIRFFILFLWTSGLGVTSGLVFQHAVGNSEVKCTPLHIAQILNNALPFSAICITFGLILVILVNSLTVRKLSKTDIAPPPRQERSIITRYLSSLPPCTDEVGSPQNIATSEQSSLNEYPKFASGDLDSGVLHGQCFDISETKGTDTEAKNSPIPHAKRNVTGATLSHTASGESLNSVSRDLYMGFPNRTSGISSSQRPPHFAPQRLPPLPQNAGDTNERREKGPSVMRLVKTDHMDKAPPTDLETEILNEVIEPFDTQEDMATPTGRHPQDHEQVSGHHVLLPNAVDVVNDGVTQVRQHQTTLASVELRPDPDHFVNTEAWTADEVTGSVGGVVIVTEAAEPVTREATAEKKEKRAGPIAETSHAQKNTLLPSVQSSPSIGETPLSPHSWLPALPATPNSAPDGKPWRHAYRLGQKAAPQAAVESPSAGYLADMSAPPSRPGTPHVKMSRRQRAERIMNLSRTRLASNEDDSEDEEPEEARVSHSPTPARGRSCRYKLPSQGPSVMLADPAAENKVHLKCVRTSHCLSAMFALAYLPLLLMQVLLRVLGGTATLAATLTYISLLLAVHPALYGYQSPILRNAIYKVAKRPKTFLPSQESEPRPQGQTSAAGRTEVL